MKKVLMTTITCLFVLGAATFFVSCSDPKETPSDVIEDADGIKVDLDWTTGGSINDALSEADLDLLIYKDGNEVLSSESWYEFERITFDASLYADGTYTVKVFMLDAEKDVNYTATVNGITVSKPVTFTSTFDSEEDGRTVDALTITKEGKKFTVKQN